MFEPQQFTFHIALSRKGKSRREIIGGSNNISVARTQFYAEVDSKGGSLMQGDELTLRQGARVILTYPPEAPKW